VFSRHALVIAAILVPYVCLMVSLGIYIWATGRHRDRDDDRDGDGDLPPLPA
jgi:hypothetical protein